MTDADDAPISISTRGRGALVDPALAIRPFDLPPRAVLCFLRDEIAALVEERGGAKSDGSGRSSAGIRCSRSRWTAGGSPSRRPASERCSPPCRETLDKARRRVSEGCLSVEMGAAALFAVARFRGVSLGQVLYAGDDLSGEAWDDRGWPDHGTGRSALIRLAAEAVVRIEVASNPPDRSRNAAGP